MSSLIGSGFPKLLHMVTDLNIPGTLHFDILESLSETIPRWIGLAPNLASLTLSFFARHFEGLEFDRLMESLRAAKHFKKLRLVLEEGQNACLPNFQVLSKFANPHFSIGVTMRRGMFPEGMGAEVYRLDGPV